MSPQRKETQRSPVGLLAPARKGRGLLVAAMAGIALLALLPAASHSLEPDEWYLRLTVEAPPNLQDPGNLLGHLNDSLDGYDFHDHVEEQPPLGWSYLTIVFPHPEWGSYASDWYTIDYRQARPDAGGEWYFEVRSDELRFISIRWSGQTGSNLDLAGILARSTLVDEETSEMVVPQLGSSYTTTMIGTVHRFSWQVSDLPLFADGFESGNLSGWNQVVGD